MATGKALCFTVATRGCYIGLYSYVGTKKIWEKMTGGSG